MNFLPAEVGDGVLRLPFAEARVERPLMEKLEGKDLVIVGIRPEHFKDASLDGSKGVDFTATVDQTEWLGNEQYAYIPYATNPAVQGKLDELDRELDGEGMRSQIVVNLDARSRVREGADAQLTFDPSLMHVFDPNSGECLTRDEDRAAEIARDSEEQRKAALARAKERDAQGRSA